MISITTYYICYILFWIIIWNVVRWSHPKSVPRYLVHLPRKIFHLRFVCPPHTLAFGFGDNHNNVHLLFGIATLVADILRYCWTVNKHIYAQVGYAVQYRMKARTSTTQHLWVLNDYRVLPLKVALCDPVKNWNEHSMTDFRTDWSKTYFKITQEHARIHIPGPPPLCNDRFFFIINSTLIYIYEYKLPNCSYIIAVRKTHILHYWPASRYIKEALTCILKW